MSLKRRRILAAGAVVLYLLLCALLFTYIGKPFLSMLDEPGQFQAWVQTHGVLGPLVYFLMTVLQVFVAVIPGEPLEIAAGYTFGWLGGTLLCTAGIALGQTVVFLLIKKFGVKALELFISREKLMSVRFIRQAGNSFRLLFVLFFIPGTPKDILVYCAGLLPIDLKSFLLITITARLPSIVTSAIGGSALGDGNYLFAAAVFVVTSCVSIGGLILYSRIKKILEKSKADKNIPQDL
ncbi:MAG: TVP38/TMEM64 family protein [Clostridia bacterium]|nr:TVP38/TMEM64 family protein [Clostridia bacterium]